MDLLGHILKAILAVIFSLFYSIIALGWRENPKTHQVVMAEDKLAPGNFYNIYLKTGTGTLERCIVINAKEAMTEYWSRDGMGKGQQGNRLY